MVNFGNGVFDFTSNVSGTANVVSGESTGAIWQNAPIDELRKLVTTNYQTSGTMFPIGFDYYVYISGATYYARNGRTGNIDFHGNTADQVLNSGMAAMVSGQTQVLNVWRSGMFGVMYVGPGVYNIASAIVMPSNVTLRGAGRWATRFIWQSGLVLNNNNQIMVKSSMWDSRSFQYDSLNSTTRQQQDVGITIEDIEFTGNNLNGLSGQVTNTFPTPGVETWGHGICLIGSAHNIRRCYVHHFVGAGLILQEYGANLEIGSPNVGQFDQTSRISETNTWMNTQQGLILRASWDVEKVWTYYNGEAGVEIQTCAAFGGGGFFNMNWSFLDGLNHANYDASGYGFLIGGSCWMSNSWIEGSNAGDALVIGRPGGSGTLGTGSYALATGNPGEVQIRGLNMDQPKAAAILINQGSNQIEAQIHGPGVSTGAFSGSRGIVIGDWNNDIDLYARAFSSGTYPLQMGSGTGGIHNTQIIMRTTSCQTPVNWANAAHQQNTLLLMNTAGANAADPASVIVGSIAGITNQNKIIVMGVGSYSGDYFRGYNYGTLTADGGSTTYNISHGLWTTPNWVDVQPRSSGAAIGAMMVTADASGIRIAYSGATPAGTNVISFWWRAEV